MAMAYKTRRRIALLVLLLALPAYIVLAVTLVGWMARPSVLAELAVYAGLGLVWALPLRALFRGIGQDDPESKGADRP